MTKQPKPGTSVKAARPLTDLQTGFPPNHAFRSSDAMGASRARSSIEQEAALPARADCASERRAGPGHQTAGRGACEPSVKDPKSESENNFDATQIRDWAADGALIGTIASRLNVTKNILRKAFRAKPELELAYESGRAEVEQELFDTLRASARKGQAVPALFALKAQFGWQENAPPPPAQVGVQIVLPSARTPEDYARQIDGIKVKQIEGHERDDTD